MAALLRTLRLEWIEDNHLSVPKNAPRWFVEMMDALRDGRVEHLALHIFPRKYHRVSWNPRSEFDQALVAYIKSLGLDGVHLPPSIRVLEAQSHLFLKGVIALVSPGKPVAPLVALSLHEVDHAILDNDHQLQIIPMAATLRRMHISMSDWAQDDHPLWLCGCVQLRLPHVDYLEIVQNEPHWKTPPERSPGMTADRLNRWLTRFDGMNEYLPGLQVLVWIPAWGDVQDLDPGTRARTYVGDVRRDVFTVLNIRTFAIVFPSERCVRFESSDADSEPQYTLVPRDSFHDLNWNRT
ncbi:hypothetical protein C8T65DRAFT_830339 [Cerioporus squamosus]|nr:hypothetical protein C8T65DRAFT_830339 [Cerioporus squamosus]